MTKFICPLVLACCATFAFPSYASSAGDLPHAVVDVTPSEVLAEVDRRAAAFDDQSYTATMQIIKGAELKKTLVFNAVMKGLDRQLIEFTAPGDVAGMKVLMEDNGSLYLYLPEFKKVRRVAAHVQNQGFLGSTFTYEDMTQVQLAPHFNATFGGKSGALTTLILTPKTGVETSFSKIELVIDGSKGGVTKLRYFDGSGAQVREQTRDEWVKVDGKLVPTKITMVELKTGDVTVISRANLVVNQGVSDDLFSRRTLLRE